MQINRLFEIVYLLMGKDRMTSKELAEHFEVTKRTILRDIDILSQAGIPIYTTQGKGGGISILDNFTLNKTAISEDEQKKILLALQSLKVASELEVDELLSRLSSLFQKSSDSWIDVDFSRWGQKTLIDQEKFALLKKVVVDSQETKIRYIDATGKPTVRHIYPLKLLYKEKSWYLQGFCLLQEDYRLFKINRIKHIAPQSDRFNPRDYLPPSFDEMNTEYIPLKMIIFPESIGRAFEDFEEDVISENPNGSFTVTVKVPNYEGLISYLLSYGASLELVEPLSLRKQLEEECNNMALQYRREHNNA